MLRQGRQVSKSALRSWLRRGLLVLGFLALLPLVLTPIYRFVPPVSTLMVASWLSGEGADRRWVPLSRIAPILVRTVISSEDSRFCDHGGVDWDAIGEAIDEDRDAPRGASTIAMQTVKNLFLWQSRDYLRKALEVPLAYYANFVLGKRRLIEIYLNIVEWGPGTFGAEAASRRAFGRSAASLNADQAALLAAALPNPRLRDPARPSPRYLTLARTLAARGAADTGCLGRLSANLRRGAGNTALASVYSRDQF